MIRRRILGLALGLFSLFGLLIVRFYQLQIIEGDFWVRQGEKQHFFSIQEPFKRGVFYANTTLRKNHPSKVQPLVVDVERYHLFGDPQSIAVELHKEIAQKIAQIVQLPEETITYQLGRQVRNRRLAKGLTEEQKNSLENWWFPYARQHRLAKNALYFVADAQRVYPFGSLLGQVLHTLQDLKEEKSQRAYPTGGLELAFDPILQGAPGKRRLMRSPRHPLEIGEVVEPPKNGQDIYLTIDVVLQTIAEQELEKGVRSCKARAGWALMMDPHTGHIWALAQYPAFDLRHYQDYFNDPEKQQHAKVKAVSDAHELGSTMKPITVAVALLANEELSRRGEKPLFSPEEKIATFSGVFPGRSKPISDTHAHHYLNMDMAIQKSSNIYVGRLVERIISRLGATWYRETLYNLFGFGRKTELELPSQSAGVLPTPGKRHVNGTFEWSTPTPFSMAFGHNLQATSVQLLRAYALLVNGGYWVEPTLLLKKELPVKEKKLDSAIADRVLEAMHYTTKVGGTSRRGDVYGYSEAGKSSTAKKIVNGRYSETQYVGSFIGVVPALNPAFLLLVSMDEPEYKYLPGIGKNHNGGTCAAPVFRDIARRALEYLGVPPDDPYGYAVGDPRGQGGGGYWEEKTQRLQALYREWNEGK